MFFEGPQVRPFVEKSLAGVLVSVLGVLPDIVLSSFDLESPLPSLLDLKSESPPPSEPESDVAKDGCLSTEMIAIDVINHPIIPFAYCVVLPIAAFLLLVQVNGYFIVFIIFVITVSSKHRHPLCAVGGIDLLYWLSCLMVC